MGATQSSQTSRSALGELHVIENPTRVTNGAGCGKVNESGYSYALCSTAATRYSSHAPVRAVVLCVLTTTSLPGRGVFLPPPQAKEA